MKILATTAIPVSDSRFLDFLPGLLATSSEVGLQLVISSVLELVTVHFVVFGLRAYNAMLRNIELNGLLHRSDVLKKKGSRL